MAYNPFAKKITKVDQPAIKALLVTPSDTVDLAISCRSLYVGVQGNVTVIMAKDDSNTPVLFTDIVGFSPIMVKRIMVTGTAATSIIALY